METRDFQRLGETLLRELNKKTYAIVLTLKFPLAGSLCHFCINHLQCKKPLVRQQLGEVMAHLFRRLSIPKSSSWRVVERRTTELDDKQRRHHTAGLHRIVTAHQITEDERRRLCYLIGEHTITRSRVMKHPNFSVSASSDLQTMAELYDAYFFGGHCLSLARHHGLKFRWSNRMTSNGGKTVRTIQRRLGSERVSYEIVLSSPLLFQTFSDLQRPIRVTGVLCSNRLQAMQRIMEHELIHLVEMLVWDTSCCAASRFQEIAGRMFGHTEHKHDLVTQQERAHQQFNIRVGSRVSFHFEGSIISGTVNRITRRATVLVIDPSGQLYDDGHRYRKYYVPLSHLSPARSNAS